MLENTLSNKRVLGLDLTHNLVFPLDMNNTPTRDFLDGVSTHMPRDPL